MLRESSFTGASCWVLSDFGESSLSKSTLGSMPWVWESTFIGDGIV